MFHEKHEVRNVAIPAKPQICYARIVCASSAWLLVSCHWAGGSRTVAPYPSHSVRFPGLDAPMALARVQGESRGSGPIEPVNAAQASVGDRYSTLGYPMFGSLCRLGSSESKGDRQQVMILDPGYGKTGYEGRAWFWSPCHSEFVSSPALYKDNDAFCYPSQIWDVDGDHAPDWVVVVAGPERGENGRLVVLSGRDGVPLTHHNAISNAIQVIGPSGPLKRAGQKPHLWALGNRVGSNQSEVLDIDIESSHVEPQSLAVISHVVGEYLTCDMNADGNNEIILASAPAAESGNAVTVIYSNPARVVMSLGAGQGEMNNGVAVDLYSDVDADGTEDLIVGTAGLVRIVSGKSLEIVRAFPGDKFVGYGAAVCALDDINSDGVRDVLVSSPSANLGTGVVEALDGRTGTILYRVAGPDLVVSQFGADLVSVSDIDGDSCRDVLVICSNMQLLVPGRIVLISGKTGRVLGEITRAGDGLSSSIKCK